MSNNIYIGQLDVRISIIEEDHTTSGTGEKTITESNLANAWAKVDDISGSEALDGKVIALNVRKYTIRYNPVIAAKQINTLLVDHDGEKYNIHSTALIGRKEFMVLRCSKKD